MLSVTLDTSCALNFLSADEDSDENLMEVIGEALGGRIRLNITQEAFEEVGRTRDENVRQKRLARLRAFGRLEIQAHQIQERDRLEADLHASLFSQAQAGSRTDDHNRRDCRQMATHKVIGRDIFLIRDGGLLKRSAAAAQHGVVVRSAEQLRSQLKEDTKAGRVSQPAISIRDARLPQDEAAIREVLGPLGDDYPGFNAWLTARLGKPDETRIRLGEYDGRVGAVALSTIKDDRVQKRYRRLPARRARLHRRPLRSLDRDQKRFLKDGALFGTELVDNAARLCMMNLFLHGIGSSDPEADPPIVVGDALISESSVKADMVMTNPPFGRKSSMTMVADDGKTTKEDLTISRQDFWATTSNKQLNFLQHIRSMLHIGGTAAVVLPDNVLFEGGAGATIRKRLLEECDVHTLLRLPTGDLLQAWRKGERRLLRAQEPRHGSRHQGLVGLRLPHQPTLHPEGQATQAPRPGRFRRRLQARQATRAGGEPSFQAVLVRRNRGPRRSQP
jgi:hypothetical protein